MMCLKCGEFNADDSTICWNCKAVLKGLAGDNTEGSAVSRMSSPGDENSRYPKGAVNRERQSVRSAWKSSLLPILAVIALLSVLMGNILQEAAMTKMSDADTIQDVVEA
ncbi:MAG TPA: hypothetical protein VMW71_07275, partial [Thermoplasmata archaeon]|nr:hypothetical protein [Thermoplasmata archaeon]